jgi:CubicO group peptidase (beta-lactamase class C family)
MVRTCLFLFIGALCLAQSDTVDTSAGRVLKAWLTALNSADRAQGEAFQKTYAPERNDTLDRMTTIYQQSGGFDLVSLTQTDPAHITGLLKQRKDGAYAEITLALSASDPPQLVGIRLRPAAAPSERPAITYSKDPYQALDQEARRTGFSGALLIARNGKPMFEKAYGLADRERKVPNTLDTKLRLGSMNKMFTAVAILQLADQGKIDLDAPLARYLPDYPNKELAAKVTIRHLLTHTGGTGNIFTKEFEAVRLQIREPADFVRLFGTRGTAFEPGTKSEYSNYGFILLGRVVELVSRTSYFDYVRQNVFRPAGMKDTDSLPETEPVDRRAIGYTMQSGELRPNTDTLPWRGTPAGGGYSTVEDLVRFAEALQTGKILPSKWVEAATRAQTPGNPSGLGFGVFGSGAKAFFGHNGGAPGMNGELRIYPHSGFVVAAIANLDPPSATALVEFFEERMPDR